jgi:hypothetical protein
MIGRISSNHLDESATPNATANSPVELTEHGSTHISDPAGPPTNFSDEYLTGSATQHCELSDA